ncbi:MAG: DUF6268 family outer membrane beta-barrel protein [Bacteroidota bacterium]
MRIVFNNSKLVKTKLLTIIFSFSLSVVLGQDIELFGVEYARYPSVSSTEADSLEVSLTEYEISALFPVLTKEKFNLLVGGTYRLVVPEHNEETLENSFYFLGLNLTGAYTLSEKARLIINAFPSVGASSSSQTFSGDSFVMQGGLIYNKEVSDRFSYNLGIISTTRFGSPIFLPLFGISHRGEKMRFDVNLPTSLSVKWNYKKRFSYGLKFSVNGSQYSLDEQTDFGAQVDQVDFSRVRLGPEIAYRAKGPLVFSVSGGMATGRTYEFEVEGVDDVDFSLDSGPFFAIRISFKPQVENN